MNELIGNSCNVALVENTNGKLVAIAEIVLLICERKYQCTMAGFDKTSVVNALRFWAGSKGLRNLARDLEGIAKEAEKLEESVSLHLAPTPVESK